MESHPNPYDLQMVRSLVTHRLLAHAGVSAECGSPLHPDEAVERAMAFMLREARAAGVDVMLGFTTGVEMGIALAVATINTPLAKSEGFMEAIELAESQLADFTKTALRDAEVVAAREAAEQAA